MYRFGRERQPVHKQHHVWAAYMLTLGDGELVHSQPIIVVGNIKVEHPRLRACNRSVRPTILDRDSVHEHEMRGTVAFNQRRRIASRQLAIGIFQSLGG